MNSTVFRIDRFFVPDQGKQEYLQRLKETHSLLRKQPGFVRDLIVEKRTGSSEFNYLTLVEWESEAAIVAAKAVVQQFHATRNFDPQEMWSRLGIKADLANYGIVDL